MVPISTTRLPSQARFLPPNSNPFATRFTRPGAQPFLFADGTTAQAVVDGLESNHWWGQIIGPHGSGKSTLVSTLEPTFDARGRDVIHLRMHENEHGLPPRLFSGNVWRETTQLVVDGYELLGRYARWRVKRHCRRRGCGLLVTSHVDVGLPTVFSTTLGPETAERLVSHLLDLHGSGELIGQGPYASKPIRAAFKRHSGDVREMLFELYDLYESSRDAAP